MKEGLRRVFPALAGAVFACAGGAVRADEPPVLVDPPYKDRIIAPDKLKPLPPDDQDDINLAGLPRHFLAELMLNTTDRDTATSRDLGFAVSGNWESPSHGSFSLDATVFQSSSNLPGQEDASGGTATLWQRNLHVRDGWRANNGVGVLNSPVTVMLRDQYRFFLPSASLLGASTEWLGKQNGLQLQAAAGQAGVLNGRRVPGFDAGDGQLIAAGIQRALSAEWSGALSVLQATDIDPDSSLVGPEDANSVMAATAWQGRFSRLQLNALSSDEGLGVWADAHTRRGRYTHNYGAFHLDSSLSWGGLAVNSDASGGYYRLGYEHARWMWNAGIDHIQSVTGDSFEGQYASAFARYQASGTLGYGGSIAVRDGEDNRAYSTQWFADKRTFWGLTRLQLDQSADDQDSSSWQAAVDQALPLRQGKRLSVSGSVRTDESGADVTRTTSLSTYGGVDLSDNVALNGSVRLSNGSGPGALRTIDLNLTLDWRFLPAWSLMASVYQIQGEQQPTFSLDPLAPPDTFVPIPEDRSMLLTVRYHYLAGRPLPVLGGGAGSAAGGISGSVFLDENGNGVREAAEVAAANVTVVLDGRYSVRTDSLGNFEFARVAVGAHQLQVISDNLPLPWFLDEGADQWVVQVVVRERSHVDIGALRAR